MLKEEVMLSTRIENRAALLKLKTTANLVTTRAIIDLKVQFSNAHLVEKKRTQIAGSVDQLKWLAS